MDHKNHGMYFNDNLVEISDAMSDIRPSRLTSRILTTTVNNLQVEDGSIFENFEGVGIGTTNFGYLMVGDPGNDYEIMSYSSVESSGLIGISTRSMFGTSTLAFLPGIPVYKYELGGVNLARINKLHTLSDSDLSNSIKFDSYNLKIDMTGGTGYTNRDGTGGYPALYFNSTKSTGGDFISATQNVPFETVTPMIHNVTIRGTNVTGELRTTTGQSMSGTEIPWVDNGFEPIALNSNNYMNTPRLIASQVNEDAKLTNVTGNKSAQLRLFLNTTTSKLSPMIDSQRCTLICTSNRVNSEITDFATDNRVGRIDTDPTACQYISKEMQLENAASSLKIFANIYNNAYSDVRAFYYISNDTGLEPIFTPFPGYGNLDRNTNQIINPKDNNGQTDLYTLPSNKYGFVPEDLTYKEVSWNIEDLPSYRVYRIKIVLTSTNQVYVPRMKDLRVMALV